MKEDETMTKGLLDAFLHRVSKVDLQSGQKAQKFGSKKIKNPNAHLQHKQQKSETDKIQVTSETDDAPQPTTSETDQTQSKTDQTEG